MSGTAMSPPTMHPAKRRRLDQSASTLSKPFRSPVRVEVTKPDPTDQASPDPSDGPHQDQPCPPPRRTTAIPSPPIRTPPVPLIATPSIRSSPVGPSSPRPSASTPPGHYTALRRRHTVLLNEISTLRATLDTTTQALKIESAAARSDLDALILQWRRVSRDAADDLFRGARDQVNWMGGVGAWRARTSTANDWGSEPGGAGFGVSDPIDEESLTAGQREQRDGWRDEAEREREKYGRDQRDAEEQRPERQDESFTMDIMLRALHIDLELIGYDAENQRWTD